MKDVIPLHHRITEKIYELEKCGYHRKDTLEKLTNGEVESLEQSVPSFRLKGEMFICSVDVYEGLTFPALKLVIRIQKELKMNNPLWECKNSGPNDGHIRGALALLKRQNIIEAIKGTELFIVNPAMIRKGKPLTVYTAFFEYCKKRCLKDVNWKPTSADIKDLRLSRKATLPKSHEDDFMIDIPEEDE
jgi:hypothetical protein